MGNAIAIVLMSVAAAIAYGIVHDQITARVCIEYFTIGHPRVFDTDSPTLLALGWSVIATWWVGLSVGVPLAIASRAGHRPPRTAVSLIRPIGVLLVIMALTACVAGFVGYALARKRMVFLLYPLSEDVPAGKHAAFIADLWTHLASYGVGFAGGIGLVVRTWRSRKILSDV